MAINDNLHEENPLRLRHNRDNMLNIKVASLVLLAAATPVVLGHGQVHSVIIASPAATFAAADAYLAVDPTSPLRKLNTYGPAANFTGPDITCGEGGNAPITPLAPVDAGSLVTFDWQDWTSVHPGPVMTYIAKCPDGCANFKGDTGNVWVKIDQDQYNPDRGSDLAWGEELLRLKNSIYSVNVPAGLENGEYILRHEILGLHVASTVMGAQFYPNCLQIQVQNGGSVTLPEGIPLPGSYDPYDPGILVQLYEITLTTPNYTAPGGPVLLPGGSGDWAEATYGTKPVSVPASPPASTASSSAHPTSVSSSLPTSIKSSSAPASSSTAAVAQHYAQCGGQGWTGATLCATGLTCTVLNAYYSQCI
ncbi:glycosyl hydrolase family 61-domain-containing protein [Cytidiella melzeri]|nr:glycosyl hydrolase family 61-domain-containing protein [Cytidiella melzeri]